MKDKNRTSLQISAWHWPQLSNGFYRIVALLSLITYAGAEQFSGLLRSPSGIDTQVKATDGIYLDKQVNALTHNGFTPVAGTAPTFDLWETLCDVPGTPESGHTWLGFMNATMTAAITETMESAKTAIGNGGICLTPGNSSGLGIGLGVAFGIGALVVVALAYRARQKYLRSKYLHLREDDALIRNSVRDNATDGALGDGAESESDGDDDDAYDSDDEEMQRQGDIPLRGMNGQWP